MTLTFSHCGAATAWRATSRPRPIWVNPGPTDLQRRDYGGALTVYFASRHDQIHFKLYALVDQGPG